MNKNIIKEMTIYFVGTIVIAVLGFVMSLLYSEMFTPSDYGIYSLALSTYSLVSQLYGGWMIQSLLRNANRYVLDNNSDKLYGSLFQTNIIMSLFFIIIFNFIVNLFVNSSQIKMLYLFLTIIYFFEQQLLLTNTMLRANSNAKQYNKNNIINGLLKIIILLFIYYILNYKSVIVITIALLISEIIQCIYLCIKLKLFRFYHKKLFDIKIIREMFLFGFPLMGVAITSWVLNTSDRYFIGYFYDSSAVGIYSYSYTLANNLFMLLIQFIMLGAYPNIVKRWENDGLKETIAIIKKYLKIYLLITIPVCIGAVLISKDFFTVLTNDNYHQGYVTFSIVCFSIIILGLSQYTNKVWELNKKTKKILLYNFLAAIINIILNCILIPIFGYVAAAVTTLISYVIYFIITFIASRKYMKIEIDISSLINVIISTIVMMISIILFKKIYSEIDLILLVGQAIIGLSVYLISLIILREIDMKKLIFYLTKRGGKNENK